MKQVYIINENHPQLLLFFAGWAADETPFKQYRPKDMDYMICYDYRTLDFDYSIFDRYRQVNVVAWSMGVWMGSLILSQVSRDKVFSLAFNGTTYPIDNLEGIPREHLSGYSRRAYPRNTPEVPAPACVRTATPTRHSWK